MKKIGIVSEYFYPHLGGITEHLYFYAKELARRGYEVVIVTGHQGKKIDVDLPPGIRVIQLAKSMSVYANGSLGKISVGWNLGKRVRQVLAQEKFDILHLHNPLDPVLPLLFLKYSQIPTVGTFHTYFDFNIYYKIFGKVAQAYLDKLDRIICVGPASIQAMKKYVKFEPAFIPNGVDIDWFAKPQGIASLPFEPKSPTILFIGRLDPRNGLEALFKAFQEVKAQVPQARLVIAGGGPLQEHYEKLSGASLNQDIFLVGPIMEERPDYLAACDVFCFPAEKANFSITLLEALAAEKPFVGFDNLGFRTVVENEKNGLLVKIGDHRALAQALIRLLQNPEWAHRIAKAGRNAVEQFSWPRITDQVLGLYGEILSENSGVRVAS